jgi:hypothetical protein
MSQVPVVSMPSELPPRTRGRRSFGLVVILAPRATPAGAGTTRCAASTRPGRPSNPRGRGDDEEARDKKPAAHEQPPRVRGRYSVLPDGDTPARATPAHAGMTPAPGCTDRIRSSYPRTGRDDKTKGALDLMFEELPPRTRGRLGRRSDRAARRRAPPPQARGRHDAERHHHRHVRETLAGARTTSGCRRTRPACPSNPRRRGDDQGGGRKIPTPAELLPRARGRLGLTHPLCETAGATPRARGRPHASSPGDHLGRATPAGAGTTRPGRWTPGRRSSNPRGRGDDTMVWHGLMPILEQPPRGGDDAFRERSRRP